MEIEALIAEEPLTAVIEETEKRARVKKFKRARRSSAKNHEVWRIMRDFPDYEISSYGNARALSRVRPDDLLKPRFVWHHGKVTAYYRLTKEGKKFDRFVGPLMVVAGLLKKPGWMQ